MTLQLFGLRRDIETWVFVSLSVKMAIITCSFQGARISDSLHKALSTDLCIRYNLSKYVSKYYGNRGEWVTCGRSGFHSPCLHPFPGASCPRLGPSCPGLSVVLFSASVSVFTVPNFQILPAKDAAGSAQWASGRGPVNIWWGGWWWDVSILSSSTRKMGGGKPSGCNWLPLALRPDGLVSCDCAQPALWKTASPPRQGEVADGAGKLWSADRRADRKRSLLHTFSCAKEDFLMFPKMGTTASVDFKNKMK